METELENLIFKIRLYNPHFNSQLIQKAYYFAQKAHQGQKRHSGEPVFNHLLATACGLADWKLDSVSIAAGLLHDVIEDTNVTKSEVEKEFGEQVATIVDGVTKISAIKLQGKTEESFVENLRKMILVMAQDLRVVLVKLSDRHHNMQTLSFLPVNKQKLIAQETLEV
ncbi:MAG: HD domain-containing protein, partial [Candidatus Curtissbacteria bacterium]|nr:HD domain-containing protein [Candidatus Curtissbacteria bacterium]